MYLKSSLSRQENIFEHFLLVWVMALAVSCAVFCDISVNPPRRLAEAMENVQPALLPHREDVSESSLS